MSFYVCVHFYSRVLVNSFLIFSTDASFFVSVQGILSAVGLPAHAVVSLVLPMCLHM